MADKVNTRITVDIPTEDHKKLKMIAAFQGKSMREVFIELLECGLERYEECIEDHTPNEITKKAIASAQSNKELQKATTIEELFKKLNQ